MALKSELTTDEFNALHDVLKAEYVAGEGGRYILDADVDAHPKVGGLKSALDKERKSTKTIDAEFRKLKDQLGDLDVAKAREAQAKLQELADQKLKDEGKHEEAYKARVDALNKAHVAELKAREQQIADRDAKLADIDGKYTTLVLDGTIRDEALRAGVRKESLPDVTYRLKDYGVDGVRYKLAEDGKVVAMAGDEIKYGKDGVSPMPIGEALESLKKTNAIYFEPSSGGGASNHARQDGNRFVISKTDAGDLSKWRTAKAAADKAGQPLMIADAK